MKFHIDPISHPQVKGMTVGQRLNITISGSIESSDNSGIVIDIDSMKVGKKGKMNITETLVANRLQRIENKLGGQAVRI